MTNPPHILVLGDLFLDEYQFGDCYRISPEAPVPILNIDHTKTKVTLGGAGNTAANVVSLGGKCALIGRVGPFGPHNPIYKAMPQKGFRLMPIFSEIPLARKTRFVGQRQQILRVDQEEIRPLKAGTEMGLVFKHFRKVLPSSDVVVLSDYAKGFFSAYLTQRIIQLCNEMGKPVIVDPKPCNASFYSGADYITPNVHEYSAVKDIYTNLLLTKGPEGMEFCGKDGVRISRPTMAKEVFDVAGAGDTVVAAFAIAIASKMPIEQAIDFANKAAGVVVGKQGTATVTREEIEKLG